MPGHVRWSIYSKRLSRGQHRYGADADWGVLDGVHIGATWRIRLNRPCAPAMRPYVKLLWPLVLWAYSPRGPLRPLVVVHSLHFAWGVAEEKCILVTVVCVSVCPSPHSHTTARSRIEVGGMVGVPSSSALLGGFAIGARVSLLWHSAERKMSASACTRSMPGFCWSSDGQCVATPGCDVIGPSSCWFSAQLAPYVASPSSLIVDLPLYRYTRTGSTFFALSTWLWYGVVSLYLLWLYLFISVLPTLSIFSCSTLFQMSGDIMNRILL